jgi:hypothetical protein
MIRDCRVCSSSSSCWHNYLLFPLPMIKTEPKTFI